MLKGHENYTLLHAFHNMAIMHIHTCNVKSFLVNKMKVPYHYQKMREAAMREEDMYICI